MLPPLSRLRASGDIERVIKTGRRISTPIATLYILSPSTAGCVRISCVVGKKVHKLSVVRHRVQRKLRAACNALPLGADRSYDMVIVASNVNIRTMKNDEITTILLHGIHTAFSS